MVAVGLPYTAAAKDAPMSYRRFKAIEADGRVTATEPTLLAKPPAWARGLSQDTPDWPAVRASVSITSLKIRSV